MFSATRLVAFSNSPIIQELKAQLKEKFHQDNAKIQILREKHGQDILSDATVSKIYGGMRGIIGFIYEPSLLDSYEGIRFRGLSIPEIQRQLPKAEEGTEPLPEGILWLLMTGNVPTKAQVHHLSQELAERAAQVEPILAVKKLLTELPAEMHPMTQYSTGVMTLQHFSRFSLAHDFGNINLDNLWEATLEDALDCMARTPIIAAMIYRRISTGSLELPYQIDSNYDWAANFSRMMMGRSDNEFFDMMRLYLTLHTDHEGGNVSAHMTVLVGSALTDPYLAYASGMNGLAGPLHGLANQEVLAYLREMLKKCKDNKVDMNNKDAVSKALEQYTWDLLNSKRVVPGYGHAVLRATDPRYTCFRDFCSRHFPNDELFILVDTIYKIMPDILTKHGKTSNPYPNVDAHSGVLLVHYGITQQQFYTVLFGLSRQLGVMTGLVWDRLQRRPIERPKSVTSDFLLRKYKVQ